MCTTTHFIYYSIDMHATQRVRRQICVKTCFYLILEFLRFLLCKEGTKEAYGTHPLVRCCFARRAQRASPQRGEVAERQRWPVGLCPFPAARSLTGKLRAGHARPLRAMARCRVAAGAGGYGSAPTDGIGRKGNNNEVTRASNARSYIALQFIKTKTPPALAGKRCLFIKLSD